MPHFFREYTVPLALAAILHAFVAASPIVFNFNQGLDTDPMRIEPRVLSVSLIVQERTAPPKSTQTLPDLNDINQLSLPSGDDTEQDPVSESLAEELARQKELEEQAAREANRLKSLEELRDLIFNEGLESESQDLQSNQLDEQGLRYVDAIYSAIVRQWSRPPSARRHMEAILRVELFPNGTLNTVGLIQSSGNDAFDRSALSAVRSVQKFAVPTNSKLFESRFRSFNLKFKAKDLIR